VTGTDRIAAPASPAATAAATAALASALPRRTAGDADVPASGGASAPAPGARAEAAVGTPDPHGLSGRLVDVFA